MGSVGGHIEAGLPKIMFFESAWHSIVHDPQGLCKTSPPAMFEFHFSVLSFSLERFLSVCVAFSKSAFQPFCFENMCARKGERSGGIHYAQERKHLCPL